MKALLTQIIITESTEDDSWLAWYNTFKEFFTGIKEFFASLMDVLRVLFPFFTDAEIAFLLAFVSIFFSCLLYLFIRKVTV